MAITINIFAIIAALQMGVIYWEQSFGKVPYKQHIAAAIIRIITFVLITINNPILFAMLAWVLVDFWVILTNIRGLLLKEKHYKGL